MVWTYLISASLCLGWMLSPDVLVRLGNGAGANQTLILLGLSIAAILATRRVFLLHHPQLHKPGPTNPTDVLIRATGPIVGTTLLVVSRMALVLLVPTGVLVTSGYAFNEIFVYWFPNFGFAYLLLAVITLLHLVGEALARKAQVVFAVLVLSSMLLLSLVGIFSASSPDVSVESGAAFSAPLLFGCLLLFLGLEVDGVNSSRPSRLPPIGAIVAGLLFFSIWAMVSIQLVPAERLSATSIPHLITARTIWGDIGRMLMGTAIIAGSCGVVNSLYQLTIGSFRELAQQGLLPGHPRGALKRRHFVLVFSLVIGILMGRGLAGYEILDIYIQAALLLWLIVSGAQSFAAAKLLHKCGVKHSWHGYAIIGVYIISVVYLIASDPEAIHMVRFLGLALLTTGIIVAVWSRYRTTVNHRNISPTQGGQ